MFTSSRYHTVQGNKIVASTAMTSRSQKDKNTRRPVSGHRKSNAEISGFLSPFLNGGGSNSNMSVASINGQQGELLLTGIMPTEDENMLRKYYRDMYYFDSVCGSTADMMSSLPFSEFSLGGLDVKKTDVFNSAISKLNLRNSLPEIALEYLVNGSFAGSLIYDDRNRNFSDMLAFNMDNVTLRESPLYSMDPEIEIRNASQSIRNLFAENSPYFAAQRKSIPAALLKALRSDAFVADPMTTIFISRNIFPTRKAGISLFKRCLPIYLLEKTLWRGTLVESAKRLRSMRHVTMGDDLWEPTPDDLNAVVMAMQEAEMDPLGGILATRQSVSISEVTNGGEFWKITDTVDTTTPMKLRALGISEAFLSGDAIYSTAETSMNVFIENQAWFRSMITHEIFYNKLFPIIAHVNGFVSNGNDANGSSNSRSLKSLNDATNYEIPLVNWHKQLHPTSDRDMLETLEKMEEKGIPVTLRAMAAAGGVSLDSLLADYAEDRTLRARIKEMQKDISDGNAPDEQTMDDLEDFSLSGMTNPNKLDRVPLLAREFGEQAEIIGETKTGKRKYIPNQAAENDKANKVIVTAYKRLQDPRYRKSLSSKNPVTKNIYTGKK